MLKMQARNVAQQKTLKTQQKLYKLRDTMTANPNTENTMTANPNTELQKLQLI